MENKYLTKMAGMQEQIHHIIGNYHARHEEIEEPINAMYAGIDELEDEYTEDPYAQAAALANVRSAIKFMAEPKMRRDLGLDAKHEANAVNTGKALLSLKKLEYEPTQHESEGIIRRLNTVPRESNGYIGLHALGTIGSTVAGGIGGAMAGTKLAGPGPGQVVGAIGGALVGGIGGGIGLHHLLKNKIQDREEGIYANREAAMNQAYATIRARLGI